MKKCAPDESKNTKENLKSDKKDKQEDGIKEKKNEYSIVQKLFEIGSVIDIYGSKVV